MKAETLKPFITSPSVTEYVGNRKRNIIVIGLSIFLFILIASLFGFTIWNSIRVTQLQKRIESLNKFVDNMHKRLGLDYLDELNEFENSYANHDYPIDTRDDDDDDASEEEEEEDDDDAQLLSNFNDYEDDKKGSLTHVIGKGTLPNGKEHGKDHGKDHGHGRGYGRTPSKNPRKEDDEDDDDFEPGSGDYDDDDDEEDDDDMYGDDDDDAGSHTNEDNGDRLFDDFEKFVGNKKRKPRSVSHSNEPHLEHKSGHIHKVHNKTTDSKEDKHKKDLKEDETQLRLIFNNRNDEESTEKFKEIIEKESKKNSDKMHESQLKHKESEVDDPSQLKDHKYHDYVLYPSMRRVHTHRNHNNDDSKTHSEYHRRNKGKSTKSRNGRENSNHRRLRTGKLYLHDHQKHHQHQHRNKDIVAAHFNLNRLHVSEDTKKDNEALLNHQRDFENSIYLPTISSWTTKNQFTQHNKQQQQQKQQQLKKHENHKIENKVEDDDDDMMQQDEPQPEQVEVQEKEHHHHNHQQQQQHESHKHNHESHKIDDVTPGVLANKQNIDTNIDIKKDEIEQEQHQQQVKEQVGISIKNGIVTIKIPGLYYIYSQIFYHNNKDRNGYWIYHNAKPYIQCYLTIPNDNIEKGNTCYTSGIIYLHKGDTVHIKDMYKDHNAILGTSKSFFGLVRLGDPEIYHKTNNNNDNNNR